MSRRCRVGSIVAVAAGRCLLVPLLGEPAQPPRQWTRLEGPSEEEDLVTVRNFLSASERAAAIEAAQDPEAWAIDDRDDDLGYAHEVWRMEEVMQRDYGALFQKLIDSAWSIERRTWGNILDFVFPEIEYIDYNVKKLAKPGAISRHTDNDSMVTMVVLLSDPSDFDGGINCFDGQGGERQVPLQQGDAVFFLGDRCHHWITPVTKGRRQILQMELRNRFEEPPRRIWREKSQRQRCAKCWHV